MRKSQFWERENTTTYVLEWICVGVFTLEYFIRLATAPHKYIWALSA